ncbi:MAG: manganese-binding transcriptional regulator MntR [Planctomycetota bacterium]
MARPSTSSPHRRTRDDHATEVAEDYVEAIADITAAHGECRVSDLSEMFGVSHVTVIQNLRKLERDGLTIVEPRMPVELTARGTRLARACRERHDLVRRFLVAIGVSEKTAAVDSEGIEHHVSKETLAHMRAFLEHTDE